MTLQDFINRQKVQLDRFSEYWLAEDRLEAFPFALEYTDWLEQFNFWQDEGVPECADCGTTVGIEFGPCPYDEEVYKTETFVWLCKRCFKKRCEDI